MSDTPRTDAFLEENPDGFGIGPFTRALERELATARKAERAECVRLLREYAEQDHLPLVKHAAYWLEQQH